MKKTENQRKCKDKIATGRRQIGFRNITHTHQLQPAEGIV
jgi:hypothetical protein